MICLQAVIQIPPPSIGVDRALMCELRELSFSPDNKIEDLILPNIRTESHEEYNERMRQSALARGRSVGSISPHSNSSASSAGPSGSSQPKQPKKFGRGDLLGTNASVLSRMGSHQTPPNGQFELPLKKGRGDLLKYNGSTDPLGPSLSTCPPNLGLQETVGQFDDAHEVKTGINCSVRRDRETDEAAIVKSATPPNRQSEPPLKIGRGNIFKCDDSTVPRTSLHQIGPQETADQFDDAPDVPPGVECSLSKDRRVDGSVSPKSTTSSIVSPELPKPKKFGRGELFLMKEDATVLRVGRGIAESDGRGKFSETTKKNAPDVVDSASVPVSSAQAQENGQSGQSDADITGHDTPSPIPERTGIHKRIHNLILK